MNTQRFHTLSRGLAAAALLAASAGAFAGDRVYWSVNVNAPLQGFGNVGTTVSNTRHGVVVGQPQGYYAPAPVVYAPPAVIVQPRPVYVPAPVAYCPPRVVSPWGWRHHGWAWGHERREREERMAWGYGRSDDRYDRGDRYERGDRDDRYEGGDRDDRRGGRYGR
jgi:hypothetical protein